MRKVLLLFVLLIGSVVLAACDSQREFDFEDGVLVVGLEAAYAPFNWAETTATDTNVPIYGTSMYAEGYDVQIARRIAAHLGLELVVKMVDWDGIIPALQSGMIDVIIAGMSPTAERAEVISFTNEYYRSEHVVVVRETSQYANATRFIDFAGANIMGQRGTVYDDLAEQLAESAGGTHMTPLARVPQIVNAILTNVVDVTIVERPVAESIVNSNPSLIFIELEDAFDLEETDKIVSFGVRQIDTELLSRLNEALATITVEEREVLMGIASINAPEEE